MRVVYTPRARQDILDIAAFYAAMPTLARRYTERIRHTCLLLGHFPQLGRVSDEDPDVRRIVVSKTPYVVLYTLTTGDVAIIHIADMRRATP